jgi:hypothetical protein
MATNNRKGKKWERKEQKLFRKGYDGGEKVERSKKC